MAEATKMSGGQFLAALKQQGPISALLSAAKSIDVSELSEDESKDIARGLKDFAGTKNGPMLIMGLPGPLQALLSFCGTTMPGLDRLGYLKASPRQALNRLLRTTDERLLKQYQFDKLTKTDWSYYLENCKTAFIAPFAKFLRRPEAAGGFSDKEIGAAVLANRELVKLVPIERIDPDSAAELMVSGTSQLLWQKYDFDRFEKQHWWKVLESGGVADLPKPCERFLANEDGKGFSTAELIELARCCDLVEQWIDPDEVAFSDAYDLYVNGKGKLLWRRFPFSGLNRSEWEVILKNREIDIPSAFVEAVNFGMFTVDDLCAFAVKNPKVFPFVGIDSISPRRIVDLLLQCDAQYLWDHYPFARLKAEDWQHLICNYAKNGVVPHAEMLGDSEGMSTDISTKVLAKNDAYLKFIPFDFVEPRLAVELMATGRHEKLWEQYDFTRLQKDDWQRLFAKSDRVPVQFSGAVGRELFSVPELCALAKKNVAFVDFIPLEKLSPGAFIDLFLETRSKKLWNAYDFSRLTGPNWKRLICSLKTKGIVSAAKHIKTAAGLTTEIVSSLLDVNPGYYKYVPVELIATDDVIKVLLSGECEELWDEFPFERFSKSDWVLFFTKTTRIPPAFDAVVKREVFTLGELCDYARHNEAMVAYLPVALLNNETLTELLILSKTNVLWTIGNLRKLDAECWVKLVKSRKSKLLTKQKLTKQNLLDVLREVKGFSADHVKQILAIDGRYYEYLPPELLPHAWVVEHLISGDPEGLWESYPFSLFDDEDWFGLLENTMHPVPDAGMVFLANEYGKVDVVRLNALLSKRRDLVGYLNPKDIEPNLAISFLVKKSGSDLWSKYDFRCFSDKQLQTIVAKAPERESWPKEISDKFSSVKGSFSDNEILSLAEKNIVNVLEMLSLKRIHQAGVPFFEKLCGFAKNSKPATSLITRKLTIGEKPWLELERGYQLALLAAIPLCRKFINWQSFELGFLDKLLTADKVYKSELRAGRKFKLFLWRHWIFLLLLAIVAVSVSYVGIKEWRAREREREIMERRESVIQQIDVLSRRSEYDKLSEYLSGIAQGEDACLLQSEKTAVARLSLSKWKTKRAAVSDAMSKLRTAFSQAGVEPDIGFVKYNLDVLGENDSLTNAERDEASDFDKRYKALCVEAARKQNNASLRVRIEKAEDDVAKNENVDFIATIVSELDSISAADGIYPENLELCKKVQEKAHAKSIRLLKDGLSARKVQIEKTDSISLVRKILLDAETLIANALDGHELQDELSAVKSSAKRREEQLVELDLKRKVALVGKEVAQLTGALSNVDEAGYVNVSRRCQDLVGMPAFARYCEEHSVEYAALTNDVAFRDSGIKQADELLRSATNLLAAVTCNNCSTKDLARVEGLLRDVQKWESGFASVIRWKADAINDVCQKLDALRHAAGDRLALVSSANNAADYDILYASVKKIEERYPDSIERRRINIARILPPEQVKAAITRPGVFVDECICDYVGVVKILSEDSDAVVPVLNVEVASTEDLYCIVSGVDVRTKKQGLIIKKFIERTSQGGFRKVGGVDYSNCQGMGLFRCKDTSFADLDEWNPGVSNKRHPHWFASLTPGKWLLAPGYVETEAFGGQLCDAEWKPHKSYLDGQIRTGSAEGEWQKRRKCGSCYGDGVIYTNEITWQCPQCDGSGSLRRKMKCEKCSFCNWKGYQWSRPYTCWKCGGKGKKYASKRSKCHRCNGEKYVWDDVESPEEVNKIIRSICAAMQEGGD